jgi:hypothetical protein
VVECFGIHESVDVIYGHRIVIDEEQQEVVRWIVPPPVTFGSALLVDNALARLRYSSFDSADPISDQTELVVIK